jgi:hypothetical protein
MGDSLTDQQIERKASRRAVISGVSTSTIIAFSLLLITSFTYRNEKALTLACTSFLLFSSPLGGLAGGIGDNLRQVRRGAIISATIFSAYGLIFASIYIRDHTEPLLFIPLFSCTSAAIGALCGGIGAMFGRTCREFEGKRFWPQFSIAELMAFVFLVAVLLSCLATLRQILVRQVPEDVRISSTTRQASDADMTYVH